MNTTDPFLAALMRADTTKPGGLIATTGRPQAPKIPPHYYRCQECLTTFTTEETFEIIGWGKHKTCKVQCDCGAERVDYLGQSSQPGRIAQRVTLCPCDARCTNASGPNCDCQCRGANHGTGLLVTVIRDAGPVPRIKQRSPEVCKAVRAEWRKALDAAEARMQAKYGTSLQKKRAGEWIDRTTYFSIVADGERILDARKLRTLKARLAKLAQVAAE